MNIRNTRRIHHNESHKIESTTEGKPWNHRVRNFT
jgi:hypothetical protein